MWNHGWGVYFFLDGINLGKSDEWRCWHIALHLDASCSLEVAVSKVEGVVTACDLAMTLPMR
jgi:hypothetical protein